MAQAAAPLTRTPPRIPIGDEARRTLRQWCPEPTSLPADCRAFGRSAMCALPQSGNFVLIGTFLTAFGLEPGGRPNVRPMPGDCVGGVAVVHLGCGRWTG